MRLLYGLLGVAALMLGAAMLDASPAQTVCSVFDRHPCAPTTCSVFRHHPCIPEIEPPIGEDLRLTIESVSSDDNPADAHASADGAGASEHKLNTLRDMFDALRACWVPPSKDAARHGMQLSVRLSFKRSGEIIAPPRVTYVSPDAPRETREAYRYAVTAALDRCTPLRFTKGLGGAVAGRPIAIRFVDNRTFQAEQP
jgi:hypothetical protein